MASCVFLSSLASFFSISRLRSQLALFGAILKRSCFRISSLNPGAEVEDKGTNQLLSVLFSILLDNPFGQPIYVLLHRIFHFHVLVISAFFKCSRLGVEISVFNKRFRILYSTNVNRERTGRPRLTYSLVLFRSSCPTFSQGEEASLANLCVLRQRHCCPKVWEALATDWPDRSPAWCQR